MKNPSQNDVAGNEEPPPIREVPADHAGDRLLSRHNEQLRLLARVSEILIQCDDLETDLLARVFREVASTIGAEMYFNYQPYDHASMKLCNWGGLTDDERTLFETMRYGELLCGRVAAWRRPIIIEDIAHSKHEGSEAVRAAGFGAYAGFPLLVGERLLGTIAFITRTKTQFANGEIRTVQIVCDQVAATLERRRLVRELKNNEQHLRIAMSVGQFGDWRFDVATQRLDSSDQCKAHFGLAPDAPFTHEMFQAALHPADRLMVAERIDRSITRGEDYEAEYRCIWPDGSLHWIHARGRVVLGAEGTVRQFYGVTLDITDRKQAEEELRRWRERLETTLHASQIVLFYQDRDLRYTWIYNPALGKSAEEVVGKRDPDLMERLEDAARLEAIKRAVIETGIATREEVCLTYHGTSNYYDLLVQPTRDSSGKVTGVNCAAVDITERKRAEIAAKRSAERLAAAFAAQRDIASANLDYPALREFLLERMMQLIPADGASLEMADGPDMVYEAATGLVADFVGLRLRIKASLSGLAMTTNQLTRCDDSETDPRVNRDACRRIGLRSMIVLPLRFGEHSYGALKLLSARVSAFGEEAEETLRLMSEFLGMTIGRKRMEDRERLLSEAAAVLLTTSEPEIMLRKLFDKIAPHLGLDTYLNYTTDDTGSCLLLASSGGVPEEVLTAIKQLYCDDATICGRAARSREPVVAGQLQQCDDPAGMLPKSMGLTAVASHPLVVGGELIGTLAFGSRTREEFNAADLEFMRTICQYVATAYGRLRLVNKLREADRQKDEFLATLAHELRNPLAPISSGLQLLKLTGDNAATVRQTREVMQRQAEQMTQLIDDLMDVSRISRGKIELRRSRINLADAVQNALDTARSLIESQGHELALELPEGPIHVDGDLTRLSQVFANLLNNAAKYTNKGGRIRFAVEPQGCDVVVSVHDNGIGIPSHMLHKVFDMFAQVDRSVERSQGGLGIGLNIAKRLVEKHGGSITAHSAGPGKGSTFSVRLPMAPSVNDDSLTSRSSTTTKLGGQRRILIVDDNRDITRILGLALSVLGHDTKTAHDGVEAISIAEQFQPEVIIMDIGMPKLNGYEACRRIRQTPWGRTAVMIAQTGWGQDEDRQRSFDAGFNYHEVKPVDLAKLEKLIGGDKALG